MATGNMQPVGKAVIVYGTVKAVSAGGFERILTPNSVIYAHERIVTGPDGSVSIAFVNNPDQLVLGRMSDVAVDEDVYGQAAPGEVGDSIAQVQDIQTALQQDGNFDPTVDLPPPSADAGVAGTAVKGGGRQIVIFTADQMEVTPDSGAETTGIGLTFLDPPPGALPDEEPAAAATATATVTVINDGSPSLAIGNQLVTEADGLDSVTGILNFSYGADGAGSLALSADGAIWDPATRTLTGAGNAWTLVVNDGGTYTFTQNAALMHGPDGSATDDALAIVVTATVTDSDGDSISRELTITVNDDVPTLEVGGQSVADVNAGTALGVVTGVLDFAYGADGAGSLALSAEGASWDAETRTLTGADSAWTLVVNDGGTYTFTQNAALAHGPDSSATDDVLAVVVTATVTDSDGDSISRDLTVRVNDDSPSIAVTTNLSVADANAGTALGVVTGTLSFDYGADGAGGLTLSADGAVWDSLTRTLTGADNAWTLMVNDGGTYTFTQNAALMHGPDGSATDDVLAVVVTATVTDSDGDSISQDLTIRVNDDSPSITVSTNRSVKDADAGTASGVVTGTLNVDYGADGAGTLELRADGAHWDSATQTLIGANDAWTMVVNINNTYTFTQHKALAHGPDGSATDDELRIVVTATVTDSDGDTLNQDIFIRVVDDVPQAVDDTNSIAEDTTSPITGNVLLNDLPGADTPANFVSWASTAATYGIFTDTGNGTYSYALDNSNALVQGLGVNETLTETFSYTMQDADGDPATATLTITITGTNDVPAVALWNDSNNNGIFDAALDNQTEIITVNIAAGSNLPGTQNVFIGDALIEGNAITAYQLASNPPVATVLTYASDVTFTFLSEGAGYQSAIGWYDVNNPTVGHVIWVNASAVDSGGTLIPGSSSVTVPNVPAGVQLGFFMIPDAYFLDSGLSTLPADGIVYFQDGKAYADSSFTQLVNSSDNDMDGDANPTWFSNSPNNDGLQHVVTGVASGDTNTLYVGFEDLGNGGDQDYNDVVFKVDLGGGNTIQANPATFDVGVSIQDADSANMSQAVLSFVLGDGDTVSYNPLAVVDGLQVTVDDVNHIYTISGEASIATYNALLDSFHITVGHSGANENYLEIDPVTRTADLQVWDASGTVSAQNSAHFDLQLNIMGSTGNEGLVGGAGNDILTGAAGDDHLTGGAGADTFIVGEGHDTIMDYTAGDKVDISDVLDTAEGDISRLDVLDNGAGKAQLAIYDNADHDNVIGSVTFDNIDFNALDSNEPLDSLLGHIDLDHTK